MEKKQFMAGAAQVVITPALPVHLLGYAHPRIANRVRDDIYAKVMVLDDGATKLALISCDLAFTTELVSVPLKKRLAVEYGMPEPNVLLTATHTHTAPEFTERWITKRTEGYEEFLIEKITEAVRTACADMFPAILEIGSARAESLAMNRLYRLKDGTETKSRNDAVRDKIIGPAGPVDDRLTTICVRDMDGHIRGVAVNFAAHPDSIGGGEADFISADWPGMMAQMINAACGTAARGTAARGAGFPCLLLQGCCGDINPSEALSRFRCGREQRTQQFAQGVAGAALLALARAQPVATPCLRADAIIARVPYYTRTPADMQRIAALQTKPDLDQWERLWLNRAANWEYDGQISSSLIQALLIGDMAMVAFPNEIFAAISLQTQKLSPFPHTITVELSHQITTTYVPTLEQARKGAYGTTPITSRWMHEDAGVIYADRAVELLWRMRAVGCGGKGGM